MLQAGIEYTETKAVESKKFPDNLPAGWRKLLSQEAGKEYFQNLINFLKDELNDGKLVYPRPENVLKALQSVDYEQVKVLILGQDPYHGPGQAVGLSFAVPNELRLKPPSLQNIVKELASDLGTPVKDFKSDLLSWTQQGVFLLNAVLTVRASEAFSHRNKGWETFTDEIIKHLSRRDTPVIFLLWGSAAIKKKALIDSSKHFILESVHPSPLSAHRGFFGSKPFSKINDILVKKLGSKAIQWI